MGLVNIQNTNFDNGVTNRNAADLFGSMQQLDPTRFHSRMEDFDKYLAADWDITGAGAGTIALTDGDGGLLLFTTAGADNDAENIQSDLEAFSFTTSFPLYFRVSLEADDVTESDIVAGLVATVADPQAPAEGVVFRKPDGAATVNIESYVGSSIVANADAITTLADDTRVTFEFYWDGIDRIYYGVDNTPLGFLDSLTIGTELTSGDTCLTVGFQAGQVAALVGTVDYLFAAKHRG